MSIFAKHKKDEEPKIAETPVEKPVNEEPVMDENNTVNVVFSTKITKPIETPMQRAFREAQEKASKK